MPDIENSPHFFYPLKRHWIERGIVTLFILLGGSFVLVATPKFIVGIILILGALYTARRDIKPLLQTHLEISKDVLSGQINSNPVYLFWQEVLVAQQTGSVKQGEIRLITPQTTWIIPLELFDGPRLWQTIKDNVPVSALEVEAYRRVPAYQDYEQKRASVIYLPSKALRASYHWGIKVMAWGCLIFSLWVIRESFREIGVSAGLLLPLAFFAASSFAIYKFSQYVEMNRDSIAVVGWFGRKEMNWSEIRRIKYHYGTELVFFNESKQLRVTAPVNWQGADVAKMVEFLDAQIEQRQIRRFYTKQRFPFRS